MIAKAILVIVGFSVGEAMNRQSSENPGQIMDERYAYASISADRATRGNSKYTVGHTTRKAAEVREEQLGHAEVQKEGQRQTRTGGEYDSSAGI
jgi:hypothetical protein